MLDTVVWTSLTVHPRAGGVPHEWAYVAPRRIGGRPVRPVLRTETAGYRLVLVAA